MLNTFILILNLKLHQITIISPVNFVICIVILFLLSHGIQHQHSPSSHQLQERGRHLSSHCQRKLLCNLTPLPTTTIFHYHRLLLLFQPPPSLVESRGKAQRQQIPSCLPPVIPTAPGVMSYIKSSPEVRLSQSLTHPPRTTWKTKQWMGCATGDDDTRPNILEKCLNLLQSPFLHPSFLPFSYVIRWSQQAAYMSCRCMRHPLLTGWLSLLPCSGK